MIFKPESHLKGDHSVAVTVSLESLDVPLPFSCAPENELDV